MSNHLSSTRSTDDSPGPSVPAAYRIYEEDRPDFEEGVGVAFWTVVAVLGLVALCAWAVSGSAMRAEMDDLRTAGKERVGE